MIYFIIPIFYFILIFSWNKTFTECLMHVNRSYFMRLYLIKILQNAINF